MVPYCNSPLLLDRDRETVSLVCFVADMTWPAAHAMHIWSELEPYHVEARSFLIFLGAITICIS